MNDPTPDRPLILHIGRKVAITAGLALAALGATYAHWEFRERRLVTVTPHAMYQSAAMTPPQLTTVAEDLGIRTVIDLRDVDLDLVAAEAAACAAAGVVHVHLPMRQQPTDADARRFLQAIDAQKPPYLVHCKHGQGRSVSMTAVYRIAREGMTNADALKGTARLPDYLRWLDVFWPGLRQFPPATDKGRFVLDYRPETAAPR
jgi:uncharacterized protein (TIGR01244 family)